MAEIGKSKGDTLITVRHRSEMTKTYMPLAASRWSGVRDGVGVVLQPTITAALSRVDQGVGVVVCSA